jgi:hypothetical protein
MKPFRAAFSVLPSKRTAWVSPERLPSTSAPWRARHRTCSLATAWPASGALSPFQCFRTKKLDPRRVRELFTREREGHAPLVNFCKRNDPRPQPPDRSNPARRAPGRPKALRSFGGWLCSFRSTTNRDVTGQGLFLRIPQISSLHHDRSRWRLCPNPIGSGTSCRKFVTANGWSLHPQLDTRLASIFSNSP